MRKRAGGLSGLAGWPRHSPWTGAKVHRRGGEQRLHAAHAFEIGVEAAGRDHGEAGEPGGELDVALGVHPPALSVVDRAHRLLGLVERVQRCVDCRHVAGADQPLAVLDPLGDRLPVARLLGQAGEVARDPGAGLLGGTGGLQEGLLARRLVAADHGEAGQHRRAGLEEVAVKNRRSARCRASPARPRGRRRPKAPEPPRRFPRGTGVFHRTGVLHRDGR